jgi:hypothetical protein
VEDSDWPEARAYLTILVEILTMPALKKEREYLMGNGGGGMGKDRDLG